MNSVLASWAWHGEFKFTTASHILRNNTSPKITITRIFSGRYVVARLVRAKEKYCKPSLWVYYDFQFLSHLNSSSFFPKKCRAVGHKLFAVLLSDLSSLFTLNTINLKSSLILIASVTPRRDRSCSLWLLVPLEGHHVMCIVRKPDHPPFLGHTFFSHHAEEI